MGAGGETQDIGGLPSPRGPYSVGCIETEVKCKSSPHGKFTCMIYYPGESKDIIKNAGPEWLSEAHASALGAMNLGSILGEGFARFLMGSLSKVATAGARVRATYNLVPKYLKESWPTAAFSHGLTGWRHVNSSFCTEIASYGCVVVVPEHTDGSACLAMSGDKILVEYISWDKVKKPELEAAGLNAEQVAIAGRDWRRAQLDIRIAEIHAALDAVNSILTSTLNTPFAHTHSNVALLGQSFGGATITSAAIRSKRFSHLCIYDPWFENDGDSLYPVRPSDFQTKVYHIKKAALWRNGKSSLWKIAKKNTERLAHVICLNDQSSALIFHDAPFCDHYAQTDANFVFEKVGALAFIYRAIKGGSSSSRNKDGENIKEEKVDPEVALVDAMDKTLALLKDWFPSDVVVSS
uniref:1-alkyl-2-acetylglycerophosphocholine esterase n=1 Tax=Aureoumbra lagunensis TaxID=44058 RepID=A0A7S3NMH6_9STRA|mmetsp:Transcript_3417/g.4786  ORF Transcript_3417/g.4786 Transcript_3417/m.4786 type:complete len:408 (-) Transcript_3417:1027-2250(-)|eukprot:CAMPEP_0197298386 /NCGR_PEP_ID=MMETSP0890-20130614/43368_1 /TAXON_ID=44058 ORGANISM="Aureoumbra lagunensis, Strain CCMP1510" /NCGR_SAMPLE_ID=MMETSP0890 /ASSEMBLY_ACC=CAM_ASM_000533 /LENGTH=407 /DNA_ID=CAMNT_0042776125 /DNA_START=81 /DNA_END=1304 /DNA_ORIENTATION=+